MKVWLYSLLLVGFQILFVSSAITQIPIADFEGRQLTRTTAIVQEASLAIRQTSEPLTTTFRDAQRFFQQSLSVVNGDLKNMKLIEDITQTYSEIGDLYANSIDVLDGANGEIGTWKYAEVLLILSTESNEVFGLFSEFIEEDAFLLDDGSRIEFLKDIHERLRRIKSAIRAQFRRINKINYHYLQSEKESEIFDNLFEKS